MTEDFAESKLLPELNVDLKFILGQPNFACYKYRVVVEHLGYKVEKKAEDVQAAVLHWMLSRYLSNPEKWRELIANDIDETVEAKDATK